MNLLSVKRKRHGIDYAWRGKHLTLGAYSWLKTQALLYNKYHHVLHNYWVLIACSDTSISNPSKSKSRNYRQTIKSEEQESVGTNIIKSEEQESVGTNLSSWSAACLDDASSYFRYLKCFLLSFLSKQGPSFSLPYSLHLSIFLNDKKWKITSVDWQCTRNFTLPLLSLTTPLSFPGDLEGKASACNAGDPGSIPDLGSSPGEGNGNPLQYSCLENPMDGGAWEAAVHGVEKSGHDWATSLHSHPGEGNGNLLQYPWLENPIDRGA